MTDHEVRALALFFFFASLDEFKAKEAASLAADEYEHRLKRDPQMDPAIGVIASSAKIWNRYRTKISRGRPRFTADSGWVLPPGIDLGQWKEFQKLAPEDELLAVIWVHILGYTEEHVGQALALTGGTLRYRVGKGLRKLGSFLLSTGRPMKVVKPV